MCEGVEGHDWAVGNDCAARESDAAKAGTQADISRSSTRPRANKLEVVMRVSDRRVDWAIVKGGLNVSQLCGASATPCDKHSDVSAVVRAPAVRTFPSVATACDGRESKTDDA